MAIDYQEVIQCADHATGIAEYSDPAGNSKFKIYVTGKLNAIKKYAEEANILSMQIAPADNDDDKLRESRMTILKELLQSRQTQVQRLNMLLPILSPEKLENISDDEWQKLKAEFTDSHEHQLDWEHDRLIEIDVLEPPLKPDVLYDLSYIIDPTVATGRCDVYALRNKKAWFASASIKKPGGNPDLYLHRNGLMVDSSEFGPTADENVSGGGYLATWRVHVYGKRSATYTIETKWVIKGNEKPGHRH